MQNPGNALSAHSMPRFIVLERDILMPIELQRDPNVVQLGASEDQIRTAPHIRVLSRLAHRRDRSGHREVLGREPLGTIAGLPGFPGALPQGHPVGPSSTPP